MYSNIVVLLDGSPFAEQALPHALGLARRSGAVLHLARVHVPIPPMYGEYGLVADPELERLTRLNEQEYFEALLARFPEQARSRVHFSLLDGDIVDAIERLAAAVHADLVVLSTHGYGPLSRFWLGSVADRIVRGLPVPILLVRPNAKSSELSVEPIVHRILVPLDGTPESERVIEPVVAIARLAEAELNLFRVVQPLPLPVVTGRAELYFWGMQVTETQVEAVRLQQKKFEADALAYLDGIAERLRTQSLAVTTRVCVSEHPPQAILDEVYEKSVDLVALETHGRHGLGRLFLGSVADKVVRATHVPVLLHRRATAAEGAPTASVGSPPGVRRGT